MRDVYQKTLLVRKIKKGTLGIVSKIPLKNKHDLSVAYTPGVAEASRVIAKDPKKVFDYTIKQNTVAMVTDGSAVLGLGNIGPFAALPVMEGKCILMKHFADVDAFPICLATQDTEEIIRTVELIAPSFGAINLEDIASPRCFEIEQRLQEKLDIPVFHDDQHGTAIVVTAGLMNALKIVGKKFSNVKIVLNGAGAAGIAIANMLLANGVRRLSLVDRKGLIYEGRGQLTPEKFELAKKTNREKLKGDLALAMKQADVFIGVSAPNIVTEAMVRSMAKNSIVFAMANPDPEIRPELAKKAGAAIVATGRSDYPNQINNVVAYPAIFRATLDSRAKRITEKMKMAAAHALAKFVKHPTPEKIIPSIFDKGVIAAVAKAVMKAV